MGTVFLHRLARLPNAWLLFSLILLVVLYPFLQPYAGGRAAIAIFDLAVLLLALRAARASGPEARLGYLLVWPAIALHIGAAFFPNAWLLPANLATQAIFHAFVVVCLLRYMLSDEVMTLDELFAAAGLYVLMAFVFAYLYALVELFAPGSFYINPSNNPDGTTGWWELLYFSFTCLSSVGFGEITPVSDHARSLVMIQQMLGVLYIALVISRLVALQATRRRS
jgi:hypothetical protein